jgi:two-component system OmpR family sensor kinase
MNLIRNAVEHTPSGTPVRIGSKLYEGRDVRLWVGDEGEPIPDEDRARIFERFARIESGRRRTEGAGLGLAIVTAIAEAHGGEVQLERGERIGNVFTIIIPSHVAMPEP